MPIYEYQCKSCHHHFDLMQKISDPPAEQCPKCFEQSLVKLVSAAGFQLKGSGWYVTDFKNKPEAKTEKNAGEGKKDNVKKEDTKTDKTKPASSSKKGESD